jgi:hypothetical protein
MRTRSLILLSFIVAMAFSLPGEVSPTSAQGQLGSSSVPDRVSDRIPTAAEPQNASTMFIENVGQFDDGARFQVRGGASTLWLSENGLWMSLVEKPQKAAPAPGLPGMRIDA